MRLFASIAFVGVFFASVAQAAICPGEDAEQVAACQKAAEKASRDSACSDVLVFCLDAAGKPFVGDTPPRDLRAGDTVTVKVLSADPEDGKRVSVTISRGSFERLTPLDVKRGANTTSESEPTFTVVATATSAPIGADVSEVSIRFREAQAGDLPAREVPYVLGVQRGRYFVEFGIAVPIAYRGTREVVGPVTAVEHTTPRVALSAIIFPQGQPDGAIRRGWRNFGIQIATDFDFTISPAKKQYYAGVAWEPIAGFGVGAGLALVPGSYLADGATVADGVAAISLPTVERYMLRPYFSIHLTSEFVRSAPALASFR